jgi:hypothetical protein
MEKIGNGNNLVGNPKKKDHSEDLSVDDSIILKWILRSSSRRV